MKARYLPGLALLVGLSLVFTTGPAFAARPSSRASRTSAPATPITFVYGPGSPFSGTRFDGEYDPATGRIYFLGFRTTLVPDTDGSVWYFDTATGTYTDTGVDMPVPVSNYGIAALNDSKGLGFYIFGGRDVNAQIVTTVQVYYPALNQANLIASDPWPGTTPSQCVSLPAMGVAVAGNFAYVLGGLSFSANGCVDDQSAETWIFNPTAPAGSRWTRGPDLNVARGYITPAVFKGRVIYAIGGDINSAGTLIAQPTVESWKPLGGSWDDVGVADLPEPCDESQAFAFAKGPLARTIVMAGCGQWPAAIHDVLQYSVQQDAWGIMGSLTDNRRNQAGALIPFGRKMYILGGYGEPAFTTTLATSEIGRPGSLPGRPVGTPAIGDHRSYRGIPVS